MESPSILRFSSLVSVCTYSLFLYVRASRCARFHLARDLALHFAKKHACHFSRETVCIILLKILSIIVCCMN